MTRDEYANLLAVMNAKLDGLHVDYGAFTQGGDGDPSVTLDGRYTAEEIRQIADWLEHLQKVRPA